jgi:hypothetical protein
MKRLLVTPEDKRDDRHIRHKRNADQDGSDRHLKRKTRWYSIAASYRL